MPKQITKEMVEHWLGQDTDIPDLLMELANGEYKPEEFQNDVLDTWESTNV